VNKRKTMKRNHKKFTRVCIVQEEHENIKTELSTFITSSADKMAQAEMRIRASSNKLYRAIATLFILVIFLCILAYNIMFWLAVVVSILLTIYSIVLINKHYNTAERLIKSAYKNE